MTDLQPSSAPQPNSKIPDDKILHNQEEENVKPERLQIQKVTWSCKIYISTEKKTPFFYTRKVEIA